LLLLQQISTQMAGMPFAGESTPSIYLIQEPLFMSALPETSLKQLFTAAHSEHQFNQTPVTDDLIQQLYDLVKLGPTGFNAQPARYLFIRSREQKAKLAPHLASSNREKTLAAPLNLIVAYDTQFHHELTEQFPAYDARSFFEKSTDWITPTATLNAALQAGYLIIAARALGLAVGPMSGFNAADVDSSFFADGKYKSFLLLNIGFIDVPTSQKRGPRLPFKKAVHII
jgi:3-hydroxypropanoate dehydrogenase